MPIPPLRKRTYGYIEKDRPKARPSDNHAYGRQQKRNSRRTESDQRLPLIFILLFAPLKLVFFIIKKVFRLIVAITRGKLLTTFVTLAIFGLLIGSGAVILISRDLPDPDKLTDRQVAQSTKIYDRAGKHLLHEIYVNKKRTLVDLSDVPKPLINGVIATEDKSFYEHKGVRPLSIARSIVYGLLGRNQVGGGASTLTQQLVKNAILTNEKTLTRKLKEIILSIRLEQKYTKEQILKIYFNEIPYGGTNYGVEAAAQSYFGKHVSEVTLQEAATLAGLPKSPSRYLRDQAALKARRDFVLARMAEEGYISIEEKNAAQAEPMTLQMGKFGTTAPHFVAYVTKQLEAKYGEETVNTGGLKVITTLDWDKQKIAEESVSSSAKIFIEARASNAALVALDPKTGQILAHLGSRDFFDSAINGQFDVATLGLRQPGSSMKPIIYAAAFAKGYTPDTLLYDVSTNFAVSGRDYRPANYDGKDHGLVTMRTALQGSLNIPAVKTLYLVGLESGLELAKRLGYTTLSEGNFGLTLVLGGGEVKLIDHTSAYGVFANNGIRHAPVAILKVERPHGETLEEWKPDNGEQILDPKVTATLSGVLSDDAARAFVFGAGSMLTLPGRPVAAKTGTTNNYVDAWTIGYTPSLVAGVWAGNKDNTEPLKAGFGGSKVAGVIWNKFMSSALKGTPVEPFPDPPSNDASKPILRGSTGGLTVSVDRVSGKLATSSTPPDMIEERVFLPRHDILHYVIKDDPRGPLPEHPEEDPQYSLWEAGLSEWIEKKQKKEPDWHPAFDDAPTEYDDTHRAELAPSLTVLLPAVSSTLFSRELNAEVDVSAPRGVKDVSYSIDGAPLGAVSSPPFSFHARLNLVTNGPHTLIVVASDDIGNRTEKRVPFILQVQ